MPPAGAHAGARRGAVPDAATRACAREGLTAAHTRAATLRGLPRRTVVWDYGMRAAAVPIVSATGLTLIDLLGGTIIVETCSASPGSVRPW
ncbi:MAG: ABC transporter permease subunit [Pseudonocardiaceae bacterium]